MIPVHKIVVPTPYRVGPVNAYFLASRPYTLVDPGPDTPQAREVLQGELKRLGVPLDRIERVLLTHFHSDHSGLARWVYTLTGAKIYIHPYDLQKLNPAYDFVGVSLPFVREAGMPLEIVDKVLGDKDRLPWPWLPEGSAISVDDGYELSFERGIFKAFHFPGHATGHLCFYDVQDKNFLSGDFLLPHITPNPFLEPDPLCPERRAPSLGHYLQGLDRLEMMDIKRVWPGHGEVIDDFRRVVIMVREHHRLRFEALLDLVQKNGRRTAFEISRMMYPDLEGFNIFMGLSEVLAHLDVLVDRGRVKLDKEDGIAYYCVA
ncbi:MBL fold metallo-hydrolase [Desulfofundulus thermobenzoicus]|uniref:MBL fold metallo-hydrolase n=1 Tax=Desulfofundulus thermobenzoicus TaxID=29376 RepID=A0A6N7IPY7_9FIRM|nr:MBL fold metallo-hydrolase [Desulfofundulus thermobenzoicus]MQL51278.1 MBL fold metallo-hydrolase [Desulfofundulus thermobenzoicus]